MSYMRLAERLETYAFLLIVAGFIIAAHAIFHRRRKP